MPPPLRIFWISGWSFPAGTLLAAARTAWPGAEHTATDPGPAAVEEALASDAAILGGYSFGAHLLLTLDDPRPRVLLAPFADLKRESALGGAVATTQIRHLRRWLQRDPLAAVADFHARIGTPPPAADDFPEHLDWGLERMLAPGTPPAALPTGSVAVAGCRDPLLDPQALARVLPSLHLTDAGHQPQPLLAAAAGLFQTALP